MKSAALRLHKVGVLAKVKEINNSTGAPSSEMDVLLRAATCLLDWPLQTHMPLIKVCDWRVWPEKVVQLCVQCWQAGMNSSVRALPEQYVSICFTGSRLKSLQSASRGEPGASPSAQSDEETKPGMMVNLQRSGQIACQPNITPLHAPVLNKQPGYFWAGHD